MPILATLCGGNSGSVLLGGWLAHESPSGPPAQQDRRRGIDALGATLMLMPQVGCFWMVLICGWWRVGSGGSRSPREGNFARATCCLPIPLSTIELGILVQFAPATASATSRPGR